MYRLSSIRVAAMTVAKPRATSTVYRTGPFLRTTAAAAASSTSSPPESESASAQSGGSRSKDASESASESAPQQTAAGTTRLMPDGLRDESGAPGMTGGGEPLESSAEAAAARPKVLNAQVPGNQAESTLTDEQKAEVDEHNREFEKKYDRGEPAPKDKVDKKFWSGTGGVGGH